MQDFKCRGCGKCCTNLEPSNPRTPGGVLLTIEETLLFVGKNAKDVIPTVAYSKPGDDCKSILYYGMINTTCPLYENGCTVYNKRPLVCRRYPLGTNILDVNAKCPVVRDGGILFDSEGLDAMNDFNIRSEEMGASIPVGSIIYVWNMANGEWDIKGVKT